jgi:hypothetical protein
MDIIKKLEKKSLSNTDILKFLDNKTNIVSYPDLKKIKDIDNLLEPFKCCVILYITHPNENYGHWCCLLKRKDITKKHDVIEFFDPYGIIVDKELKWIPKPIRQKSGQDFPYITKLLLEAINKGYKIEYNNYRFQHKGENIRTCGRWVSLRLFYRNLTLEQFKDLIHSYPLKPDETVTLLTYDI